MAEHTYRIEIYNIDHDDASSKTMASTAKKENASEVSTKSSIIKGMALLGFAENISSKYINHRINTVSLQTGHTELQDKLNFTYGITKRAYDVAKYIMAGSIFGPAGGAVGAVLGVSSQLIDYSIKMNELQVKREMERIAINLNNIRIGTRQNRTNRSI